VIKGVELNCLDEIIEIFENHCYLRYYPHYDATKGVTIAITRTSSADLALKWVRTLEHNSLIKLNEDILAELMKLRSFFTEENAQKEEFVMLLNKLVS
jgi:hypothetical protein